MDQTAYADLMARAVEGLRAKTSAHINVWRLDECDWAVDQDSGKISFTRPDGIIATADVQIIATYNTDDGTLLWGWDHPAVQPPLAAHAARVRAFGVENDVSALTTRKISCTEQEAWEYAALACELNDAQGAYRGPSGPTLVFMTFGSVTLSTDPSGADAADDKSPEETGPANLVTGLHRVDRPDITAFFEAYFDEMFQIEKTFNERTQGPTNGGSRSVAPGEAIAAMEEIYARTWRRAGDHWRPSSIGWPSKYEWSAVKDWTIFQIDPQSFRILYNLDRTGVTMEYAYDVAVFDDGIRIVDFHF